MHRPAVVDQRVAAQWRDLCARYDRDMHKSLVGMSIVAAVFVLGAVLLGVDLASIVLLLGFGSVISFGALRIFLASTLMCPKCNDPPQPIGRSTHPRRARFCDECGCTLAP